jgi:hypothetical protein
MQNRVFFIAVFGMLLLLLGGCASKTPTPQQQPKAAVQKLPAWFLNPPQDNTRYMYGVAMAQNRESAVKAALDDMVSKLRISIRSSYSSKEQQNDYYSSSKVSNEIQAEVANIQINNYSVVAAQVVGYGQFAVLVRTDKKDFVNGLIDTLQQEKRDIDTAYAALQNKNPLSRYEGLQKLQPKLQKLRGDLNIVDELYASTSGVKKFDKLDILSGIVKIHQRFLDAQNALNFYIVYDKNSTPFVDTMKDFLSKKGLNIVERKKSDSIIIALTTQASVDRGPYMEVAVVRMHINVLSGSLHLGGRSIILKERYNGSMQQVYQRAAFDLHRTLADKTVDTALGITLE